MSVEEEVEEVTFDATAPSTDLDPFSSSVMFDFEFGSSDGLQYELARGRERLGGKQKS